MKFYRLIFCIIFFVKICRGNNVKKLESEYHAKERTFFVYEKFLYEDVCYISSNVLICKNENVKNSTMPNIGNQIIENVRLSLNFTNILKKNQLLQGREADIKQLFFLNNAIAFIENETFDNFTSLNTLNFYQTNLTTIDENVLTQKLGSHLRRLYFAHNNISYITPSTFIFMSNLTGLSLEGNNHIGSIINNGIFTKSLNKVEWLYLSDCNITVLNDNIFANLKNLKHLQLSSNPITSIPKAINIISNLFSLSFDNTSISTVKHEKQVFNKKIQVLSFFGSKKLINIEDCALCNFPNLAQIYFSKSSHLSNIHYNAFGSNKDMPMLLEVKLEWCNISSLPQNLLLRRLKLYLQDNPINSKGIYTVNVVP